MNSALKKVVFNCCDSSLSKTGAILNVIQQTCVVEEIVFLEAGELSISEVDYLETESGENQ